MKHIHASNRNGLSALLAPASQDYPVLAAAKRYLRRKHRLEYPKGKCDKGGRWWPDDDEAPSHHIRVPSRAWPWSIYKACCSAEHCARLSDLTNKEEISAVRRAIRDIVKANPDMFVS